MSGEIHISQPTLKAGAQRGVANMQSSQGRLINALAAEQTRAGNVQAYFLPAVRMAIDSTFAVMELPEVATALSPEVANRQTTASSLSKYFSDIFIKSGLLLALYKGNDELRNLPVLETDYLSLSDPNYIGSLCAAPFYDARKVCGGALRLLARGRAAEPAATISSSRNLLTIAGVHKDYQRQAHNFLGDPYVHQRHLELVSDEDGSRVAFTKSAQQQLAQYMEPGRGCPANVISSGLGGSLLDLYWPQFVKCLVPPDATADV